MFLFLLLLCCSVVSCIVVPFDHRVEVDGIAIESYAGTIPLKRNGCEGVKERGLFYWYLPSDTKETPLMIWLQGGPGASSMTSLFYGHGPFQLDKENKVSTRDRARAFSDWPQLYIDQPVGSGLSYVLQKDGQKLSHATVMKDVTADYPHDYHRGYAVTQKAIAQYA